VSTHVHQLPSDIETLHALLVAARAERDAALTERDHALSQIDRLRHLLRQLQRAQFGKRSEKLDPEQLLLALEDIEQAIAGNEAGEDKKDMAGAEARAAKRRANRGALPPHLPRVDVTIEPEDTNCPCCRAPMHVIGEETSQRLDVIPAQFRVIVTHRPKYACRACAGEVQAAPLPAQVIEQGLATPGLLAHVAVQKFCDHMPLARQSKFFDRHGIELPRSTLTDWMLALGLVTQPLVERMGELLKTLDILGSDDTPMPWQNERVGKTTTARLWVWRGAIDGNKPLLLYQFAPDRSGEHAAKFLEGWRGYLQADAYSGYDRNFVGGHIIEVGCMAHARRRYFEIAKNAKTPGFAHDIVQRIAEIYAIEREAKERNLGPPERQRLRQERAPPLLAALKERLDAHLPKVPPKGPLAEAIGYSLNHWKALTRYLEDGRLEIDNNAVERAIRPVAQGRANWLFVASERGGHAAAALYSLIESAKANGHNPYAYLRDVLTRLPVTKAKDIDALLPHLWRPQA